MSPDELPPVPRPPTRAERPRRPRQRTLTREAIVAAALAIVDAEGLDGLNMRTVAHALGTGQASLYAYVSSKEDLLEAMIEQVIGDVDFAVEPDPARWQEQVKVVLRNMRATFGSHKDLARASFARIPLGENALRGTETMIGVLRAGNVPDQVIAWACDLLPLYVMATAYEEGLQDYGDASPAEFDAFIESMRSYFAGLPPERFPHTVALADRLTAGDGDERFEFGLDVLVRGLAAMRD